MPRRQHGADLPKVQAADCCGTGERNETRSSLTPLRTASKMTFVMSPSINGEGPSRVCALDGGRWVGVYSADRTYIENYRDLMRQEVPACDGSDDP